MYIVFYSTFILEWGFYNIVLVFDELHVQGCYATLSHLHDIRKMCHMKGTCED